MRWSAFRWFRVLLPLFLVAVLAVAPAQAQDEEPTRFKEPDLTYRPFEKPYIQWIAGSLLTAAVLFVAFKNPHRSHLD